MAKKSTKVKSSPVTESAKKGNKRGANEAIGKVASAKKQKLESGELEKKQPEKVESMSFEEPSKLEDGVKVNKVSPPSNSLNNDALPISEENDESDESSDDGESLDDDNANEDGGKPSTEASNDDGKKSDEISHYEPLMEIQANDSKLEEEKSTSIEESLYDGSSDEETSSAPVKNNDTDVEMVDASQIQNKFDMSTTPKAPKTPATHAPKSKTLFVGNLSFEVKENELREFFKAVAEVVEVRLASYPNGKSRRFGHVEVATHEDAQKALDSLNGEHLLDRPVRLELAQARGAITPNKRENNSCQKGGDAPFLTAFVKGFDKSLGEDEIRSALLNHFGSCGNITRVSIPPDFENGGVRGVAYMGFEDMDGLNKALELNTSELDGCELFVEQAKPKGGGDVGGRPSSLTAYVKGFDSSLGEDEIRSALLNHFGSCGNITRVSIPPDFESVGVRRVAYMDFEDINGLNKALELNASEVDGCQLVVQLAKPKGGGGEKRSRGGRGGGSGGRFGGRGGDCGRFGARGDRFGARGDRFGGCGGSGGWFGGRGGSGGRFGGRGDRFGGRGGSSGGRFGGRGRGGGVRDRGNKP